MQRQEAKPNSQTSNHKKKTWLEKITHREKAIAISNLNLT